jgi:hypothetical protein
MRVFSLEEGGATMAAQTANVPVKSAWLSKINWTSAGAAATSLIIALGIDIPADKKAAILSGLTIAQSVLTWIFRTWFNASVPPSSL